ncbi:hypothetical protein PR048_018499 [Dryococelus australis]|uniref:Uncharacterized protein n=1 Tax=Dryococelus australis TaxID=614101 RepID=A0ABQ9HCJ1_9NEOP|nr:hypothetical protein PR048_018499 [Dryococelus australis]
MALIRSIAYAYRRRQMSGAVSQQHRAAAAEPIENLPRYTAASQTKAPLLERRAGNWRIGKLYERNSFTVKHSFNDLHARPYSLMYTYADYLCALVVCWHSGRRRLGQRSPGGVKHRADQWLKLYGHTSVGRTVFNPRTGHTDFRKWESCRAMPLIGGFSPRSPVTPPPLRSGAAPFSSHFTLVDSQNPLKTLNSTRNDISLCVLIYSVLSEKMPRVNVFQNSFVEILFLSYYRNPLSAGTVESRQNTPTRQRPSEFHTIFYLVFTTTPTISAHQVLYLAVGNDYLTIVLLSAVIESGDTWVGSMPGNRYAIPTGDIGEGVCGGGGVHAKNVANDSPGFKQKTLVRGIRLLVNALDSTVTFIFKSLPFVHWLLTCRSEETDLLLARWYTTRTRRVSNRLERLIYGKSAMRRPSIVNSTCLLIIAHDLAVAPTIKSLGTDTTDVLIPAAQIPFTKASATQRISAPLSNKQVAFVRSMNNKVTRSMAKLILRKAEEYTMCVHDLKRGFRKCSFYREQSTTPEHVLRGVEVVGNSDGEGGGGEAEELSDAGKPAATPGTRNKRGRTPHRTSINAAPARGNGWATRDIEHYLELALRMNEALVATGGLLGRERKFPDSISRDSSTDMTSSGDRSKHKTSAVNAIGSSMLSSRLPCSYCNKTFEDANEARMIKRNTCARSTDDMCNSTCIIACHGTPQHLHDVMCGYLGRWVHVAKFSALEFFVARQREIYGCMINPNRIKYLKSTGRVVVLSQRYLLKNMLGHARLNYRPHQSDGDGDGSATESSCGFHRRCDGW